MALRVVRARLSCSVAVFLILTRSAFIFANIKVPAKNNPEIRNLDQSDHPASGDIAGAGPFSSMRRFRVSSEKIRDRSDTEPPELEITEFVPIGMMVIVNGRTEPGATLWAENEQIDVSDDGTFYTVIRLRKEGVNELRFVAQDTAEFGANPESFLQANGIPTAPGAENAARIVDFLIEMMFGTALSPADRQAALHYMLTDDLGNPADHDSTRIREIVAVLLGLAQFQEQ